MCCYGIVVASFCRYRKQQEIGLFKCCELVSCMQWFVWRIILNSAVLQVKVILEIARKYVQYKSWGVPELCFLTCVLILPQVNWILWCNVNTFIIVFILNVLGNLVVPLRQLKNSWISSHFVLNMQFLQKNQFFWNISKTGYSRGKRYISSTF